MKKKIIIHGAMVLIIFLIILIFLYKTKHGSYTLDEAYSKTYPLEMPINNPFEAVQYFKNLNVFNESEVKEMAMGVKKWRVYANRSSDIWYVGVISHDILPSFSCVYSFTIEGEPINEGYVSKPCSWNK